ncbi:hypothetical protein [Acinetobacter bereziniae]|uniref:hypothetical protein n=1 Tax=Acinetobacter bereziniae TaxID=106648 RepID=UPI0021CD87C0|nr:hypothetical protein [Acinetobacter bereziniae]
MQKIGRKMMAQLFYKLLEQPKKAFIFCLIIANLCLWAIGFIKGVEVLWVLGFLFFTAFSAFFMSLALADIVEKKFSYKIYFQLFFYGLLFIIYMALNKYKMLGEQSFYAQRIVMFLVVFFTMLLMLNLRATLGYSFESIKLLWRKYR